MTTELRMLALSVVLGFVHILASGHAATRVRGVHWNMGARDASMPPLEGVAGRLDRASANFKETFALFAAAVLIAHVAGRNGALTFWGTQLYFFGRLVYLPVYALGIAYVRSLVWGVATLGIVLVLAALI